MYVFVGQLDVHSAPCYPMVWSLCWGLGKNVFFWNRHLDLTATVPSVFPNVSSALISTPLCFVLFCFPTSM